MYDKFKVPSVIFNVNVNKILRVHLACSKLSVQARVITCFRAWDEYAQLLVFQLMSSSNSAVAR